jgi:predicted CopG family antitoxin
MRVWMGDYWSKNPSGSSPVSDQRTLDTLKTPVGIRARCAPGCTSFSPAPQIPEVMIRKNAESGPEQMSDLREESMRSHLAMLLGPKAGGDGGLGCRRVQGGSFFITRQNPWRLSLNTHTYTELIMSTKTISITEEAYERLKNLKKDEKTSFSDVIIAHYPKRKKLSEVLKEIGANPELADSIETVSREMRKARLREVRF